MSHLTFSPPSPPPFPTPTPSPSLPSPSLTQALLKILPRPTGEDEDERQQYYTPAGVGKVICTVCNRIFLNARLLKLHCQSYAHQV